MKWIGQSIIDFIARFRSDVYLEGLSTSSETDTLVVDSDGKITKNTALGGDITSVVAGDGLTGGATSGAATVNIGPGNLIDVQADQIDVDLSELTDGTADIVGTDDEIVYLDDTSQKRKAFNELKLGQFNNDQGWTANTGDITGVAAGTNLSGGGSSSDVTINLADASDTVKGAASFHEEDFIVSSGAVTLIDLTTTHLAAATLVTESETIASNDNDTTLPTSAAVKDYADAHIGQYVVLRSSAFYVNDNPMVQNSLYFGSSIGNTPMNWNDPQAAGGAITSTSSFTIAEDDMNWGIILPFNISKIEVQCSLRPALGNGDDFTLAIYTGVRSNASNTALTLTKVANSSSVVFDAAEYVTNDLDYTADLARGTMIYVGVGSEDATDAKQGRGYMNITVVRR